MAEGRSGEQSGSEKRDEPGGGARGADRLALALAFLDNPTVANAEQLGAAIAADDRESLAAIAQNLSLLAVGGSQAMAEVRQFLDPANAAELDSMIRDHPDTAVRLLKAAGEVIRAELKAQQRTSRMVNLGMFIEDEPETFAYEPRHRCTVDCPSPWRQAHLLDAIRAVLHDGYRRRPADIAAELGTTPWGSPGYFYEDVMRVLQGEYATGRMSLISDGTNQWVVLTAGG